MVGEFIKRLRLNPNYNEAATSLIVTDWQFEVKRGELWQENPIFCQGLNFSLEKSGHIQQPKTDNPLSQVGSTKQGAATYQEDSDDDCLSLLEQLELATSETTDESSNEVVNVEHKKEVALTSSGQGNHNRGSARGIVTKARAGSNEGGAFPTDEEDFVLVSAAPSSSASQENEKTTDEDEIAWPSWTGM